MLLNFFHFLNIVIFIMLIYIKKINLNLTNINIYNVQILFCIYLIINSYFLNDDNSLSLKSIFYFRFILSAYIIYIILKRINNLLKLISILFLICSIFLSFDIIYQSLTGYDILGFKAGLCVYPNGEQHLDPRNCERFSGFFGDEYIAGSYLSTYGIFFLYMYFTLTKKNLINNLFIFFSLLLIIVSIIISGERNAFLSIIIILFFNLVFNKIYWKYSVIFLTVFFLIISISSKKFNHIKYRYVDWPISIIKLQDGNNFQKLLQTPWGAHFVLAYDIFQNNKIFGSGFKSFRIECKKKEYNFQNLNKKYHIDLKFSPCTTHPHNIYFEVLSEVGIVGLILFILLLSHIIIQPLIKNFNNFKNKELVIFSLSVIITFIFPFRPTGSFTSSVYMTNLFFFIGFYLYFVNNLKRNK